MRRHLGLITLVGFAAAVILLYAAWMMSGGAGFSDIAMRFAGVRLPSCGTDISGQTASREIAWRGADTVGVEIPSNIHYSPNNADQMLKVTGNSALLPHVIITDENEVKLDCRPGRLKVARFEITLPGRGFRTFSVAGLTNLTLSDIDQPELNFNIAGNSSVTAAGKVESLHINGAGLSEAKMGALQTSDARFNLAGNSNVEAAVDGDLELNAVGNATLTLRTEPKSIKTHVLGSSRIIHASE